MTRTEDKMKLTKKMAETLLDIAGQAAALAAQPVAGFEWGLASTASYHASTLLGLYNRGLITTEAAKTDGGKRDARFAARRAYANWVTPTTDGWAWLRRDAYLRAIDPEHGDRELTDSEWARVREIETA
jgi:hypothetical protein